jgi:hypothetical protein
MDSSNDISRYFWLFAIGVSLIQYMIGRRRIMTEIGVNQPPPQELLGVLGKLFFLANLPWLIMGVGVMVGGVPLVSYLRQADAGGYVIAWDVCVLALVTINTLWITLGDGLRQMRDLQKAGAFGRRQQDFDMPDWAARLIALFVPVFMLLWLYLVRQKG